MMYTAFLVVEILATERNFQLSKVRKSVHRNNNIVGFWETTINTKQ